MTVKIPVRLGRSKPVIQVKESDIQKCITDWLGYMGIWFMRLNTGAMSGTYNGRKRFIRFCKPGTADILCTIKAEGCPCWPCWIEVKAAKGMISDAQLLFKKEVEAQGHGYILARDLDDVKAFLLK